MNCRTVRSLLMTYLDSELDVRSSLEVGEHLERCDACRARFEAEARLERLVARHLGVEAMPEDVWRRLCDGAGAPAPRARRGVLAWASLAVAAAAAALVIARAWSPGDEARLPPDLVDRLVAAGERTRSERVVLDIESSELGALRPYLEPFLDLPLPASGVYDGHPVQLVGALRTEIDGQAVVDVSVECCGERSEVLVMDLGTYPREARPVTPVDPARKLRVDGQGATVFAHGDLLVTVVDGHHQHLAALMR